MDSKANLINIGHEGFALLDEHYASQRSTTFLHQYQPQKPKHYQINPVSRTEKITVIQYHDANPDLVNIGIEGFASLEKYYGKKPGPVMPQKPPVSYSRPAAAAIQGPPKQACYYRYQPEKPQVYQMKPTNYATEEKVMNAYEAAKLHGGVLIITKYTNSD